MATAIEPYTKELIPAVKAFNQRLAARGIAPEFQFPESNIPDWLPRLDGRQIYQEYYLAVEDAFVRGGFILKYQGFLVNGQMRSIPYYHLPVSEGIVNKTYASIGVLMLRSALKMQPALFALGMGGFDRPLPQMLKAMGWSLCAVPFYFRINHPARFLRQIAVLRQDSGRRLLADLATFTGTGWLGIKAIHLVRTRSEMRGTSAEQVDSFGPWADELWQQCSPRYAMAASRDKGTLNILYPRSKKLIRLKITRGSRLVGWAVLLDTQMRDNKYFGNLRLGTIADCFALPEDAPAVVQAATRFLEQRGVDLIVCNHSHEAWGAALTSTGFLTAPSNFIFAASKSLAELLIPFDVNHDKAFLDRGDGDGPVNL